jgi:hypothetical protein
VVMDIDRIEFRPPLAIGRLGGAPTPMDNYVWREDPTIHGSARTVIDPALSFEVLDDGSLVPFIPTAIRFRDGDKLRPVAPFFELWAHVIADGDAEQSRLVPLTHELLTQAGGKLTGLVYDVAVANRKAARRSGSEADAFAAVIQARGDDHGRQRLLASSIAVPDGHPLVLPSKPIPLGWFHVIRPTPRPLNGVDLDVLRVRFTPAEGHVYGPPSAVAAADPVTERTYEIVPAANRILNPDATWLQYRISDIGAADTSGYFHPDPPDTYDGAGQHPGARDVFDGADRGHEQSWGVVDDTCDGIITAHLVINGKHLSATARICVGPPDYAPDRRPFLSLADDLADRDLEPTTAQAMTANPDRVVPGIQRRLADLFQRVWETADLTNLDAIRARALTDNANAPTPNGVTGLPAVNQDSMRPLDTLAGPLDRPSQDEPSDGLILTRLIDDEHGPLADEYDLMDFLSQEEGRLRVRLIVRPAYGNFDQLQVSVRADAQPDPDYRDPRINRDRLHDMRMPPYMRDELAGPLSLTRRQYAELIAYLTYLDLAAKAQAQAQAQILQRSITIQSGDLGFPASVTMDLQGRDVFTGPSSEYITPPMHSIIPPVTTPLRRRIDARLHMISGDGQ